MSKNFDYILDSISSGEYQLTLHARQRMAQRNVTNADIKNCGATGVVTVDGEKFKVVGKDIDDCELTVICAVDNGILIITIF